MEADNEYIAFEPGKLITFRTTSGPMPLEASYLVEPAAGGTKLTSRIEMHAAGFVSLAEPLIARGLRREMNAALTKLKGLLEAPASTAATSIPAARRTDRSGLAADQAALKPW
jgi:hypothetical protein